MRLVVFAAGGAIPAVAIRALATRHDVVAVVRPGGGALRGRLARLARALVGSRARDADDPAGRATREVGAEPFRMSQGGDEANARRLAQLRPDALCIATFPWILRPPLLAVAPLGAVNLHPSLLPRHRGPNPYLWAYHANDAETGMTVHMAASRADAGPIVARHAVAIPRGYPVGRLHADLAGAGGELILEAMDLLSGGATPTPQDESAATLAPRVAPLVPMTRFGEWPAERVWHFLAGMVPRFIEPLHHQGRLVAYAAVEGYESCEPRGAPGAVEASGSGWRVWCLDGVVHLCPAVRETVTATVE